jgi:hypothetical protein
MKTSPVRRVAKIKTIFMCQLATVRWGWRRYAAAGGMVAAALLLVGASELVFGTARFFIVASSIALSVVLFGVGAGLFALFWAILLSDFFLIPPAYAFNMDGLSLRVAGEYTALFIVTDLIVHHTTAGSKLLETIGHLRAGLIGTKPGATPSHPPVSPLGAFGHVDGVVEGELYGWALDADRPLIPLKVTINVNQRPVAEALAVYYRPDVAEQLLCTGRNGFYVDLTQCCDPQPDALIDVRFQDGTVLANSPVFAPIPVKPADTGDAILFMHIAKTAGTAFREAILKNYKQSQVAYLYSEPPGFLNRDLRALPLEQRARLRFVVGHFQFGIHEALPQNSCYVTIVRHPLRRILSHYLYLMKSTPEIDGNGNGIPPVKDLFEKDLSVDLDNLMVRCFGGVDEREYPTGTIDRSLYDLAVHNIHDHFEFIGHQERLGEAYRAMQEKFAWCAEPDLEVMNRNPESQDYQPSAALCQLIEHHNRWDFLLYEEIQRLFP